mmetsp:Transcript_4203/g.12015  ORF Transcript_4203/g.12015 Transcript_4203/m.12015 type:complete len:623 (-) Transcript_4203:26-1894(-)
MAEPRGFTARIEQCYLTNIYALCKIAALLEGFAALPQVVLVAQDIAIPLGHLAVGDGPDLVGHLRNQTEVVGNQYHTTVPFIDRHRQGVYRFHVQMVGGLVQQQHVRAPVRQPGEYDARLESVGELTHRHGLVLAGDAEPANGRPHLLQGRVLPVLGQHVLERRLFVRQELGQMLVVLPDLEMIVPLDHAVQGVQVASHELEQGRLSGSVRSNDGNARVEIDAKVHVRVQDLVSGVAKGDVGELQDGWRELAHVLKVELDDLLRLDLLGQAFADHFRQHLLLGLGLAGELCASVTEPRNVFFHVGNLVLLPSVLLHLVFLILSTSPHVRVVVASVVVELLLMDVDDVRAHPVQKVLAVTHQQQNPLPLLQRILQPYARLQIQMIRRLVQHQKRRLHEQRPRQRDPHAPPSREIPGLLRLHLLIKPKSMQNTRRSHLRHVRIQRVETLVNILHPRLHLWPLLRHQLFRLLLKRRPLRIHLHHGFQRREVRRRHLAVQKVNVDMLWDRNLPRPQRLQQRRLPAPVGPQQPIPATVIQLQIRILQQLVPMEQQRKLLEMNVPRLRMGRQHPRRRAVVQLQLLLHLTRQRVGHRGILLQTGCTLHPRDGLSFGRRLRRLGLQSLLL